VAGACEYGDEPADSGATDLVNSLTTNHTCRQCHGTDEAVKLYAVTVSCRRKPIPKLRRPTAQNFAYKSSSRLTTHRDGC
jgi:hypothetical protein